MGTKTFYTVRDIELLVTQGISHLALTPDTVITDLAREQAEKLGLALVENGQSQALSPTSSSTAKASLPTVDLNTTLPVLLPTDLAAKVKVVVMAQMNGQVSETLLDTIIRKVIDQLGLNES